MYQKTTNDITVSIEPTYLDNQSSPDSDYYVWAYHVRIENKGTLPVKLQHRQWQIIDAMGREQQVYGLGVVGEQPLIPAGGAFEYTSGTPLSTPSGIMAGSYGMSRQDGSEFLVDIPAFSLDSPYQPVQLQ